MKKAPLSFLPYMILVWGVISTATANQTSLQTITQANNLFSSQFYDVIRKSGTDNNLIVSPFSVSVVLAMQQAGARGETKKAIHSVLHFPDDEQLNSGYQSLLQNLGSDENVTLELVNRIYPQKGYPLNSEFTHTLTTYYSAEPQQLNYAASEEAAYIINTFVSNFTHGKISNLVQSTDFDPATRLSLINAIYFKGNWETQFPKEDTKKSYFYVGENEQPNEVDMMHLEGDIILYADIPELDATAVSLPYQGNRFSMLILLPNERFGLVAMEEKLKNFPLQKIVDSLKKERVLLYLPKFKLESTIDLKEPLTQLGLGDIFSEDKADFTGISGERLYVSMARQKAFIEVNEEGSEAAAAIVFEETPFIPAPIVRRKCVRVDHPFLSIILTNRISSEDDGNKTVHMNNVLFYARVKAI